MSSRREQAGEEVFELAAVEATRYYWLGRLLRIGFSLGSLAVIASQIFILWITLHPLYIIRGSVVVGEIGLTHYTVYLAESPVRIPVLDSLIRISFALILGSTLSIALVLPVLVSPILRAKVPRIYLEAAATGFAVAGLTIAFLISILRVLYRDIIPTIPVSGSNPTPYGLFTLHASGGYYTIAGIYSTRLASLYPIVAAAFIGISALTIYFLITYYEELAETPVIIAHNS